MAGSELLAPGTTIHSSMKQHLSKTIPPAVARIVSGRLLWGSWHRRGCAGPSGITFEHKCVVSDAAENSHDLHTGRRAGSSRSTAGAGCKRNVPAFEAGAYT